MQWTFYNLNRPEALALFSLITVCRFAASTITTNHESISVDESIDVFFYSSYAVSNCTARQITIVIVIIIIVVVVVAWLG